MLALLFVDRVAEEEDSETASSAEAADVVVWSLVTGAGGGAGEVMAGGFSSRTWRSRSSWSRSFCFRNMLDPFEEVTVGVSRERDLLRDKKLKLPLLVLSGAGDVGGLFLLSREDRRTEAEGWMPGMVSAACGRRYSFEAR